MLRGELYQRIAFSALGLFALALGIAAYVSFGPRLGVPLIVSYALLCAWAGWILPRARKWRLANPQAPVHEFMRQHAVHMVLTVVAVTLVTGGLIVLLARI